MHLISHSLNHIILYSLQPFCFLCCFSFVCSFFPFISFYFSSVLHTHTTQCCCFFFCIFYNFSYIGGTIHVSLLRADSHVNGQTFVPLLLSQHTRDAVKTLRGCHFPVLLILKVCEGIRISHVPPARQTLRW